MLNISVITIIINPLSLSDSQEGNLVKSPQKLRLEMIIAFQLQITKEKNNENLISRLRHSH